MIKLITKADQFGAVYRPTFNSKDAYQTFFGGLITITLYSLCISYMVYMFIQWGTHQILPRSSLSEEVKENLYMEFDYDLVQIKLSNDADPFSKVNNILVPQFYVLTNQVKSDPVVVFPNADGWVIPKNYKFKLSPTENLDAQLQFIACSSEYIIEGMTCASDQEISDFFNSKTTISVVIYVTKFNVKTEEFYRIPKKLEFIIQKEQTIFNKYSVKTSYAYIDNGVVFPENNQYQFISDYTLATQSLQLNTQQQIYKKSIYAQFTFSLDNIQQINYITYAHLDEVLASIGSIWSIILILSYCAVLFNEFNQSEYLYRKIISFYYPQFRFLQIRQNFIGKITKVTGYGQSYDPIEFTKYYEKLKQDAAQKMKVKNILYEISRIQFILQSIQERNLIVNSHNVGIKLKLLDKDSSEFPNILPHENQLNDNDFMLLSKQKLNSKTDPGKNKFYQLNVMNHARIETTQVNTSQDKFTLIT
ncbi:unnamed protein product (macronuclear) [Paramecium tetraurelia]|uniref:Transmembrane protein n=1 Tax=Paramecium tetraurelia TaxID=5888 RepID=A0BDA5_PARTE|nr:uncharacterized protein GSPATT00004616001 [Paramecium tetraurelia]CAK56522.1 unnamed protein product [Paramecium tetraurelia]|eukprot:XP_001423920.1 hypothetical protein (macronuclear) [Paramecium tetraurelia strain d4-2]